MTCGKGRILKAVDFRSYFETSIYSLIRGEMGNGDVGYQHVNPRRQVARPVTFPDSEPAECWRWNPGMPLQQDIWNIPSPRKPHVLTPDALIIPLVGADR